MKDLVLYPVVVWKIVCLYPESYTATAVRVIGSKLKLVAVSRGDFIRSFFFFIHRSIGLR